MLTRTSVKESGKGSVPQRLNCDVWLGCIVKKSLCRVLSRLKIVLWKGCWNRKRWTVWWVVGWTQGVSKLAFCELSGVSSFQNLIFRCDLPRCRGIFLQGFSTGDWGLIRCCFPCFPRLLWLQANGHDFLCQLHLHRFAGFGFRGGSGKRSDRTFSHG